MIIIGNDNRGGCCLPWGALLFIFFFMASLFSGMGIGGGASFVFVLLLPVLIFIVMRALATPARPPQSEPVLETYEPVRPPVMVQREDPKLASVRALQGSVARLLDEHKDHPILNATGEEIRTQANELLQEAERLVQTRQRLRSFLTGSPNAESEVAQLRAQAEAESDPKVRSVLLATLERREAELENLRKMSGSVRYFDALLEQAEATMSELRSRIGLAMAQTEDYTNPRAQLALTESSNQLRSVSEAMRETLNELG